MGNHSKRKKVAALLKAHGFSKLYTGNKKKAWKSLPAAALDEIIFRLQYKPGDIVSDCDYMNHKIASWKVRRSSPEFGSVIEVNQFFQENGQLSCGCLCSPDRPLSRLEIEAKLRIPPEEKERLEADGWWSSLAEKRWQALQKGLHIVDENGIVLPEYSK